MFNQINQLHNIVLSSSVRVGLVEIKDPEVVDVCLCDQANIATSGKEKAGWLGSLMVSGVVASCRDVFPVVLNTAAKQLTLQRAASMLVLGCKSPASPAPAHAISLGLRETWKMCFCHPKTDKWAEGKHLLGVWA